jgi:hypothetical protein
MNKRFEYAPSWWYRNPKIGFYSLDLKFPSIIFQVSKERFSFHIYAWSDVWINKISGTFTLSLTFLGFGFKFHHRNKRAEYGQ